MEVKGNAVVGRIQRQAGPARPGGKQQKVGQFSVKHGRLESQKFPPFFAMYGHLWLGKSLQFIDEYRWVSLFVNLGDGSASS